jgi:hypothetical protein
VNTCRGILPGFLFIAISTTALAQFRETPPAPYPPAVAREKIRTLIGETDPADPRKSADVLSDLLVWYRDVVDDELIAGWKGEERKNLPGLISSLADARVASAIVDFSWRQQRAATFDLAYAPVLGDLMARYPESAAPLLHDLLPAAGTRSEMPELSQTEAAAVCRILLDMPDTDTWKKTALQILPHYRVTAQSLLLQDLRSSSQDKVYRARFWMADLKIDLPGSGNDPLSARTRQAPPPPPPSGRLFTGGQPGSDALLQRPHIVEGPSDSPQSDNAGDAPVSAFSAGQFPMPYSGPRSGTLKCSGGPIPPSAEYVFPGMPQGNLQVELDSKVWGARLVPAQGQTQDLILTNKSSSPQKRCSVRWNIMP